MQCSDVGGLTPKGRHQLACGPHFFEWVEREDFNVFDVFYAGIGVFFQEAFQHLACLFAVFGKVVTLLHILGALASSQWRLVKSDVADQVESVVTQPTSSASGSSNRPCSSSSCRMAALRSALLQRNRNLSSEE